MISLNLKDHWNVFDFMMRTSSDSRLHFQCLAGCTALEATLGAFWQHEVLPEWAELLTYVHAILEDPETPARLANLTGSDLREDEWRERLRRFAESASSPTSLAPSFFEFAIAATLLQGSRWEDPLYAAWIRAIASVERLRHLNPHTAASNHADEKLLLHTIMQIRENGLRYSPFFAISEASVSTQKAA